MGNSDFDELVRQILSAAAPGFPADRAREIALQIRRDGWGGQQLYIGKAPSAGKTFGLGTALAAGEPIARAFAAVGVSESYGYRLLRRRWVTRY